MTRTRYASLATLALMLLAHRSALATDYFISPSGDPAADGLSASNPTTLDHAITLATSGSDTIVFGTGTYNRTSAVNITTPVRLTGPSSSILDCSGVASGVCLRIRSGSSGTTYLSGLTVRNGTHGASDGAVVVDQAATFEVLEATFSGNTTGLNVAHASANVTVLETTFSGNAAGIVSTDAATLNVFESTFSDNTTAGINLRGDSNAVIRACSFDGNKRGVKSAHANEAPVVEKNTFDGDEVSIELSNGSDATIRNNLIQNATMDGAVSGASTATFIYNTVVNASRHGFFARNGDTSVIYNNIFYSNGSWGCFADAATTGATVAANGYYDNTTGTYHSRFVDSGGHVTSDPLFVSSTDFDLQGTSPMIDKANTALAATPDDIEDVARAKVTSPSGNTSHDIGAYEAEPIIRLYTIASTYVQATPSDPEKDYNYQVLRSNVSADGTDFHEESGLRISETPYMTDADIFKTSSGNWVVLYSKAVASPADYNLYRATGTSPNGTFTIDTSYSDADAGIISTTLARGTDFLVYGMLSTQRMGMGTYDVTTGAISNEYTDLLGGSTNVSDPSVIALSSSSYLMFYKVLTGGSTNDVYMATSNNAESWSAGSSVLIEDAEVPGAILVDGTIYLYFANTSTVSPPPYTCNICVQRSTDSGATWSTPEEVTGIHETSADPHPVAFE